MVEIENMSEKSKAYTEKAIVIKESEAGIVGDDLIKDKVRAKLNALNIDYDLLTEKLQGYLYKIESIISDKTAIKKQALEMLKNTTIDFSSIAATMNISRTTLYNNEKLELYINYSKDVFDQDDPYAIIDKLKISISELENQVSGMVDRDIEISLAKQNVMVLNLVLAKKEKSYNEILERRNIISAENTKLKAEIRELRKLVEKESDETDSKIKPLNRR